MGLSRLFCFSFCLSLGCPGSCLLLLPACSTSSVSLWDEGRLALCVWFMISSSRFCSGSIIISSSTSVLFPRASPLFVLVLYRIKSERGIRPRLFGLSVVSTRAPALCLFLPPLLFGCHLLRSVVPFGSVKTVNNWIKSARVYCVVHNLPLRATALV